MWKREKCINGYGNDSGAKGYEADVEDLLDAPTPLILCLPAVWLINLETQLDITCQEWATTLRGRSEAFLM